MPELGTRLQEQTFILVASRKAFIFFLGGEGGEDDEESYFTVSVPVLYKLPFPFFFLINFFLN